MILVYHKIDCRSEVGVGVVSPEHFAEHVDAISRKGYRFVDISTYMNEAPTNRTGMVALMFDDAYENVHHYAFPLMAKRGLVASVAVISDFAGQMNSWDVRFGKGFKHATWPQLREMREAGWEMASHTCTHRYLPSLTTEEQQDELSRSKMEIQERTGGIVNHLVYPFGRASLKNAEKAAENGYKSASVLGQLQVPPRSPFFVKRSVAYSLDTGRTILRKLDGSAIEKIKEKALSFGSNMTILTKRLGLLCL